MILSKSLIWSSLLISNFRTTTIPPSIYLVNMEIIFKLSWEGDGPKWQLSPKFSFKYTGTSQNMCYLWMVNLLQVRAREQVLDASTRITWASSCSVAAGGRWRKASLGLAHRGRQKRQSQSIHIAKSFRRFRLRRPAKPQLWKSDWHWLQRKWQRRPQRVEKETPGVPQESLHAQRIVLGWRWREMREKSVEARLICASPR